MFNFDYITKEDIKQYVGIVNIVDMLSKKKLNPIVTELFIRGTQLNISLVFITQSYFALLKNIRLNSTDYFIMKLINKQELQ